MLKVIAAAALVVVFLVPAVAAFAGEGTGGDRAPIMADQSIQAEPTAVGTVAGTDKPYFGPYFEQRLENIGE
jgi:hypothetical protein